MKTVRVVIAVAVDYCGGWNAVGWSDEKNQNEIMRLAVEGLRNAGEARYFLTADLQVPEPATEVKADVTIA